MRHSLSVQLRRPLQVESLGSALLLVGHHVFGLGVTGATNFGSQNLVGTTADWLARASSLVQAGLLIWIWAAFARGKGGADALIRSSAAALCVFIAFGKVMSPQFLIWLIPIVPLVRGRRGLGASALLGIALVLTQIWFPFRYYRLALDFEEGLSWLLLARDLTLVALVAVLTLNLRSTSAAR